MKKSKIISALLCASMVIGMLSGCGGGSSVPASGENAGNSDSPYSEFIYHS